MSTYSSNLKIELIGTGEQVGTWGTTTNSNFSNVFETAIVGRVTVNFATDANKTLSTSDSVSAQDFRNVYLNLTSSGSLSTTRDLIVPTINKNYIVQNNTTGGQSIRVITAAGTGITVPNGATSTVYVDGTNVIAAFNHIGGNLTVANNLSVGGTLTLTGGLVLNGNVTVGDSAADTLTINSTITSNMIFTDNTYDIGAVGATRPRTGYFGTSVVTPAITVSGLTSGRVPYASTGGLIVDSANLQFNGTILTANTLNLSNALTSNYGGTGQTTYTAGDMLYYASGTTLTKLGIGTNGQVLTSTGSAPQWTTLSGVAVTTISFGTTGLTPATATGGAITVAGVLNVSNGGTGLSSLTAGYIPFGAGTSALGNTANLYWDNTNLGLGLGSTSVTAIGLRISTNATGATSAYGVYVDKAIQSGVTTAYRGYHSEPSTAAASFTLGSLIHYGAYQGTIGAGSTVTNQYGFFADSTLVGATNDYGFYSNIASGTGRWNFYSAGTAANYFGGATTVEVSSSDAALRITQTGAGNALLVEDSANPDSTPTVITAAGDVGIGTSSVVGKLHVYGDTNSNLTQRIENANAGSSAYANLQLRNDATNTCELGIQSSTRSTTYPVNEGWLYASAGLNLGYAGATKFYSGNAERMRLDNSGNLGLGVTPSAWGSSHRALQLPAIGIMSGLNANSAANYFNNSFFNGTSFIYGGNGAAARYEQGAGVHAWYNAPSGTAGNVITFTQAMTLTSDGNLGIGSTSTDTGERLRIGTTSGNTALTISATGVGPYLRLLDSGSSEWAIGIPDGVNAFTVLSGRNSSSAGIERIRIDASGNLGVGTSSPTARVTVSGTNTGSAIDFTNTTASTGRNFRWVSTNAGAFAIEDITASATRLTVDSSGNLGLGVTPSAWASGRAIQIGQGGAVAATTSGSNYVSIGSNWSQPSNNRYITSDFATLYEQGLGRHVWYNAPSGTAGNAITFTQAMTLNASGQLLIGTTSASGNPLIVNGTIRSMQQGQRTTLAVQVDNTNGAVTWPQPNLVGHYWTGSQDAVSVRVPSSSTANTGSYDILADGTHLWYASGGSNSTGSTASERMRINSSGVLLVGTTTTTNNIRLAQKLALVTAGTTSYGGMSITNYGNGSDNVQGLIDFNRSRGTTDGSMTIVANNDALGAISFRGSDGTNFIDAAFIRGDVDGIPGTNDMPGRLIFATTADGASSATERMRLDSSGNLGLGVTPSAWVSTARAIELGGTGSNYLAFNTTSRSGYVYTNAFWNGSNNIYKNNGQAAVYAQVNGAHEWYTAPSGTAGNAVTFTQAMTLDASGNFMLGTTTPIGKFRLSNGSGQNFVVDVGTNLISLQNYGGTGNGGVQQLDFYGSPITFTTGTAGSTSGTERMRIDSSGRWMLGTTSPSSRATIAFSSSTGGLTITTTDDNALYCQYLRSGVTFVDHKISGSTYQIVNFSAGVSLAASGTSWGSLSDERQKDIIEPIINATEKVASLRAVIGKYKTDNPEKRRAFLIAQDVQAVLPEAVYQNSDEDDTLNLAYTDTIPLLVAAIKEQQAIINDLKARIEQLESK